MGTRKNDGRGWSLNNFGILHRHSDSIGIGNTRPSLIYPRMGKDFVVDFNLAHSFQDIVTQPNIPSQSIVVDKTNKDKTIITALVRTVDRPSVAYDTQTLNAYNYKYLAYTGRNYNTINVAFHDDSLSLMAALVSTYRRYYEFAGGSLTSDTPGNESLGGFNTPFNVKQENEKISGLVLRKDRRFFDSIVIYDLGSNPDAINVYTLINPRITQINMDPVSYENAGPRAMSITFGYEEFTIQAGINISKVSSSVSALLGLDVSPDNLNAVTHGTPNDAELPGVEKGTSNINDDILDFLGQLAESAEETITDAIGDTIADLFETPTKWK